MRLIDADALEREYREQFAAVYKNIRDSVLPSDFYIERKAAYDKELVRRNMEAFCKFLRSRPTIDAEPVRHGWWLLNMEIDRRMYPAERVHRGFKCSLCGRKVRSKKEPYCHCGAKMDLEV